MGTARKSTCFRAALLLEWGQISMAETVELAAGAVGLSLPIEEARGATWASSLLETRHAAGLIGTFRFAESAVQLNMHVQDV